MSFASKILITFGILFILFSGYLVFQRYSPKTLEFKNLTYNESVRSKITPIRIIIPSLKIDNSVFSAKINKGQWEATTKGISYLSTSPVPGESGNSILYGHNWPSLLGNLTKVKPGEKIEIIMSNGEKRKFIVQFTSIVDSSQTHILSQTNDNRITLYTCTGFLDRKRFVATAILSN